MDIVNNKGSEDLNTVGVVNNKGSVDYSREEESMGLLGEKEDLNMDIVSEGSVDDKEELKIAEVVNNNQGSLDDKEKEENIMDIVNEESVNDKEDLKKISDVENMKSLEEKEDIVLNDESVNDKEDLPIVDVSNTESLEDKDDLKIVEADDVRSMNDDDDLKIVDADNERSMDDEDDLKIVEADNERSMDDEDDLKIVETDNERSVDGKEDLKIVDVVSKGSLDDKEDIVVNNGTADDKEEDLKIVDIVTKGSLDDKEDIVDKENSKNKDVINVDSSEDEDDRVGVIRIRDFGSIREDTDDDDDDDDIVEVPRIKTVREQMNETNEVDVSLDMDCGEEPTLYNRSTTKTIKVLEARQKLKALHETLKDLAAGTTKGGIRVGLKSNKTPVTSSTGLSTYGNVNRLINLRGLLNQAGQPVYSSIGQQNNIRLNTARAPISIIRTRNLNAQNVSGIRTVTTNRATQPTAVNNQGVLNVNQPLTQLIFDPTSGLLLCPTNSSGNQNIPMRSVQTIPGIQPSQLQAAVNSGLIKVSRQTVTFNGQTVTRIMQTTPRSVLQTSSSSSSSAAPLTCYAAQSNRVLSTSIPNLRPVAPGVRQQIVSTLASRTPNSFVSGRMPVSVLRTSLTPSMQVRGPSTTGVSAVQNIAPAPAPVQLPLKPGQSLQILTNPTPQQMQSARQLLPPSTAPPASASVHIRKQPPQLQKAKSTEEEITAGSMQPVPGANGLEKDSVNNSKTFPSLVVMVKPCLQDKLTKQQASAARSELDLRVKTILLYSPSKFTEWLMQKRLLRVENRCMQHFGPDKLPVPYKLGMYSDGRQPFSGGYQWISDCCPDKPLSVFQGSIFESSVYPPGTLMKLMYHWACQTPATNVLQWVKVTSYYLKNFYTLLRSACVAGIHENCSVMGGKGKYVEIGIITLGTTVASGAGQKQVKIEILGVFDPSSKCIRMKVINPQVPGLPEANHERINQILWPLNNWVDKNSVILIDVSMDKSLLEEMGFLSVNQSRGATSGHQKSPTPTNVNVMNYLKNIVPKMFQNTLCVLSKSLIQQFLDELSWREMWGGTPPLAFDCIINHLVQMTIADTGEPLIARLNKISLNPFAEWSYSRKSRTSGIECLPDSIRNTTPSLNFASTSSSVLEGPSMQNVVAGYIKSRQNNGQILPQNPGRPSFATKRKADDDAAELAELNKYMTNSSRILTLQTYYYISCPPATPTIHSVIRGDFPQNVKCPLCSKLFKNNLDALGHIMVHVLNVGRTGANQLVCKYCLKELVPGSSLMTHVNQTHKFLDVNNCCRICNEKQPNEFQLILHMWKHHVECEAPYRCEVCEFRSSFHYDVVDHFHKEHLGLDCIQCPVCLKVLTTKSIACLKHVVVHLQNHMIRKGKKCPDCCLVFSGDQDYRTHIVTDKAHCSLVDKQFKRQKLIGVPIAMAKPPKLNRKELNPPPAKKSKVSKTPASTSVTTLNSALSVPLNPDQDYMYNRVAIKISDSAGPNEFRCWECGIDVHQTGHFKGVMKCSKCKYETCCHFAITTHARAHLSSEREFGPHRCKPRTDLTLKCRCGFYSSVNDRIATHLTTCIYKTAYPAVKTALVLTTEETIPILSPPPPLHLTSDLFPDNEIYQE